MSLPLDKRKTFLFAKKIKKSKWSSKILEIVHWVKGRLSLFNLFIVMRTTISLSISCGKSIVVAETASWADSGQLQFWSEPSEILNLRSPNTQKTVAFNIP